MPASFSHLKPTETQRPALGAGGDIEMQNRVLSVNGLYVDQLGVTVASANNMVLPTKADSWHISGTTQINLISATGWRGGSRITLIFNGSLTVKNNQAATGDFKPILLNSGSDFSAAVNSTLSLLYDSVNSKWLEIGRKA